MGCGLRLGGRGVVEGGGGRDACLCSHGQRGDSIPPLCGVETAATAGAIVDRPMGAERVFDVVIVAEPEGGYSVFVPELPSVASQGETIEEARANVQEAIKGYLEVMHEDGLPIPSVHRDRVAVDAA